MSTACPLCARHSTRALSLHLLLVVSLRDMFHGEIQASGIKLLLKCRNTGPRTT